MAKNCAIIFLCGKERGKNYTGNACENFAMYCKKNRDIKEICDLVFCNVLTTRCAKNHDMKETCNFITTIDSFQTKDFVI